MPSSDTLLFLNAAQIARCTGAPRADDGNDPAGVRAGAGVAVAGGRIVGVAS
jgi:hypothetical protein